MSEPDKNLLLEYETPPKSGPSDGMLRWQMWLAQTYTVGSRLIIWAMLWFMGTAFLAVFLIQFIERVGGVLGYKADAFASWNNGLVWVSAVISFGLLCLAIRWYFKVRRIRVSTRGPNGDTIVDEFNPNNHIEVAEANEIANKILIESVAATGQKPILLMRRGKGKLVPFDGNTKDVKEIVIVLPAVSADQGNAVGKA